MQSAGLGGMAHEGTQGVLTHLLGLPPSSLLSEDSYKEPVVEAVSQQSGNPESRLFCHKRPDDLQNVTSLLSSNKIKGHRVEKQALHSQSPGALEAVSQSWHNL